MAEVFRTWHWMDRHCKNDPVFSGPQRSTNVCHIWLSQKGFTVQTAVRIASQFWLPCLEFFKKKRVSIPIHLLRSHIYWLSLVAYLEFWKNYTISSCHQGDIVVCFGVAIFGMLQKKEPLEKTDGHSLMTSSFCQGMQWQFWILSEIHQSRNMEIWVIDLKSE